MYRPHIKESWPIILRDRKGNQIFRIDIKTSRIIDIAGGPPPESNTKDQEVFVPITDVPSWSLFLVPMNGVLLTEPQTVDAFLSQGDQYLPLGVLSFGLAGAPPLTPDRVAAIKSDPRAIQALRMDLGCKYCDSKLRVYAALEKSHSSGKDAIWYQDLPDSFDCSCGKTHMSLAILRSNMHALLGQTDVTAKNLTYSTLYEHRAIDKLSEHLLHLVNKDPREEEIQQFLSQNPVLFHFLSPQRLFQKPPILSIHQADFAILDTRGTLFFIEIERPDILLLRKDGAISAEMEHALTQVRDWLFLYEKHRAAVLQCLDLTDPQVTRARGMVIAGRDKPYDAENLRRFKWQDRGAIDCITYDDLLNMFATLGRQMKAME